MRNPRALSCWLFALLVVLSSPAWASWSLVLPGTIDRVVSAGPHVAVVQGSDVLLLREDGANLGRLADPRIKTRRSSSRPSPRAREDVLDFFGIDESMQDNAWVEDELNNESTLAQRRTAREAHTAGVAAGAPAIAAQGQSLWIANAAGLWYWPAGGDPRLLLQRPLSGARLSAAANGRTVVTDGRMIWVLSEEAGVAHLVTNDESPQHISFSPLGERVAWARERNLEVRDLGEDTRERFTLSQPLLDLRYCGEDLLLLSQDALGVLSSNNRPTRLALGLQARRLACFDDVSPWFATDPGLLTSRDRGHTWTAILLPFNARVFDVALGNHGLWVATDRGLFRVSQGGSDDALTSGGFTRTTKLPKGPQVAPWWSAWLPQVTIAGGAVLARGRRDLQTVALASFPLDAPTQRRSFRILADNSEVPMPHAPRPLDFPLPPDPDAECLPLLRAKAVTLALVEPDRARSYVDRARHAAWLPELRLRVDRRFGRSESLDVPSSAASITSPLGVDTVDDVRYEARVTWDLARLVFSNDELAAQAQSMHMAQMRRDIETVVSRLYFERRRLRIEPSTAAPADRSVRRDLRLQEIEAELDALTAGGFSQCTSARNTGQGAS